VIRPGWLLAALVMTSLPAPVCLAQSPIVGTWRGTSTCADKVAFPSCHDEVVVYEVLALGPGSDSVRVRADKVVGGAREFMGELLFGQDSSGGWLAEVHTARYHDRWRLRIEGDRMSGTLVDLPSGRVVRHVVLRRDAD
jgi:hypothetical protein